MADRLTGAEIAFLTANEGVEQIELTEPWTLIEADVVRDRELASWPSLKTDLRNAGATWVDREVVVDTRGPNTLVTSRKPADLPVFCAEAVETFAGAAALR